MKKMTMRWLTLCGLVALLTGSVGCLGAGSDGDGGGGKDGYCSISTEQEGAGDACDSTVDCADGLRCERLNGQRVCLQLCDDNDDCDFSVCNVPDDNNSNNSRDDNNVTTNNSDNNSTNNGGNNSEPPNNSDNNSQPPPNNSDNNSEPPPNNNDNNSEPPPNNSDNNSQPPPNNNDNNSQPPPNNNSGPSEECVEACSYLRTCSNQICDPSVIDTTECLTSCEAEPESILSALDLSCEDINFSLCRSGLPNTCDCPGDGPNVTNVGDACNSPEDCEGGDLPAVCIAELPGGTCSSIGCQSDAACGTGNVCIEGVFQGGDNGCLQGCDIDDHCRTGYICADIGGSRSVCLAAE